jgi:N-acetylglucosaminyldiphosphoundecaprenol N-acetyl-beta-D-mannosaminyltransferase
VVNVAKLVRAREDRNLHRIIEEADLVGVDGMALVWYSKLLPECLPEKVSGIDIMMNMFRTGNDERWSFYFLGATEQVIQRTVGNFKRDYRNAIVAGSRNGYFKMDDEPHIVEEIGRSGANILLIGFGSPRKEMFVEQWKGQFGVNVIHGVGGSFDVYAGVTKRAPTWMQSAGLEWLYRLVQEPVRLFSRYAVSNTKFLLLVIRDRLGILDTTAFQSKTHSLRFPSFGNRNQGKPS